MQIQESNRGRKLLSRKLKNLGANMNNNFKNWSDTKDLRDLITNPLIKVGKHSYYSGYYENSNFEDGCVRYLWGDQKTKAAFNPTKEFGWDLDKLIIGNYVAIASGVIILMGGNHNHRTDWITIHPFENHFKDSFQNKGDTIIKSDAWLGMNSMIMPGVTIGQGAIVAARSVVTKDVAPYTIVGGNPARLIKKRFTDEQIEMLMELRWFDWTDKQITQCEDILMSSNIEQLYDFYQENILK